MSRESIALELQATVAVPADCQIVVPHRQTRLTRAALKYAASLTDGLNFRLRLIDVHVVPYGVPLDRPTVSPRYVERKLRSLAQECSFRVSPEIVYARDWEQGFRRALGPASVVLIAFKRSWWRSGEKRLANRLRKLGHQVIWVECEN
jgi:hypothetical protein